jgi:hypothetical protein
MRDDCAHMSPPSADDTPKRPRRAAGQSPSTGAKREPGVLSSLPSTRPQRPSARRAAARRINAAREERAAAVEPERIAKASASKQAERTRPGSAAQTRTAKARHEQTAKPRPAQTRRTPPKPAEPPVPRQGFEADEEILQGRSVQPPSGTELAGSVAELFGELAQAGLSTGGRLLKDALTRLSSG